MSEASAVEIGSLSEGAYNPKEEARTVIGRLYSAFYERGITKDLYLSASGNLDLLDLAGGGKLDSQLAAIGDIDIFTTRGVFGKLKQLGEDDNFTTQLGLSKITIEHDQVVPFFGTETSLHAAATIQMPDVKRTFDLDIFGNFNEQGQMHGLPYLIVPEKHTVLLPLDYKDGEDLKHIMIPTFKADVLRDIYKLIDEKQKRYKGESGVYQKPRGKKIEQLHQLNTVSV